MQHGWGSVMDQICACPGEPENITELHHAGAASAGHDGQRTCGMNSPFTPALRSERRTVSPALSLVPVGYGVALLTGQRARQRHFPALPSVPAFS